MGSQAGPGGMALLNMAGKGKQGQGTGYGMGQQTPNMMYSYGGTNMSQADANAKYQADMAAWRAPTTTGTGKPMANPTVGANPGYDGGPALPAMGVLPTAPVAIPQQPRNRLAWYMGNPMSRGGSSPGYSTSSPGSAANRSGSSAGGGSKGGGLY